LNQKDSFSQSDSDKFLDVAEFLLQHNRELSPFSDSESEYSRKGQYIIGTDSGLLIDLNLENGTFPFGYQSPFSFKFEAETKSSDFETFGEYKIGFIHLTKDDFFSQLSEENVHFVDYFVWKNSSINELIKTSHSSFLFTLEKKVQVLVTKEPSLFRAFQGSHSINKMFSLLNSKVVHNNESTFLKIAVLLSGFCHQNLPQARVEGRMVSLPFDFFSDEELQRLEKKECLRIKKSKDCIPLFFTSTLGLEVVQRILQTIASFKD